MRCRLSHLHGISRTLNEQDTYTRIHEVGQDRCLLLSLCRSRVAKLAHKQASHSVEYLRRIPENRSVEGYGAHFAREEDSIPPSWCLAAQLRETLQRFSTKARLVLFSPILHCRNISVYTLQEQRLGRLSKSH